MGCQVKRPFPSFLKAPPRQWPRSVPCRPRPPNTGEEVLTGTRASMRGRTTLGYNPKTICPSSWLATLATSGDIWVGMHAMGCRRSCEHRLSCELPSGSVRAELWVGEIRDALMPRGPVCPSFRGSAIVRYGKRRGVQRYKCKECRSYFTDLAGSALHRVRRRDLWLDFCQCMVEGLSVRQTARSLGISKNTAFPPINPQLGQSPCVQRTTNKNTSAITRKPTSASVS